MPNLAAVLQINSGVDPDQAAPTAAPIAPIAPSPAPSASATPTDATVTYDLGDGSGPQSSSGQWVNNGALFATDDGRVVSRDAVKSATAQPAAPDIPRTPDGRPVVTVRPQAPAVPPKPQLAENSAQGKIAYTQALLNSPKDAEGSLHPDLAPPPDPNAGKRTDILSNVGAGANEAIASALGAPVDLVNAGVGAVERGINSVAGTNLQPSAAPFGGSQSIKQAMGLIGANPDDTVATSSEARVARGIGAGAGSVLAPMGVAGAIDRGLIAAPQIAQTVAGTLAPASLGNAAGTAAAGGLSAGVGQTAEEVLPDKYATYANLGGQVLGGVLAGGIGAGVNAASRTFGALGDRFTAPMGLGRPQEAVGELPNGQTVTATTGQQMLARQRLLDAASNPGDLARTLNPDGEQIIPGSQPTTGQASGDMGVLALERAQAAKNPELFNERRAEQTQARWDALDKIRPANADPFDAREYLDQTLGGIKSAHEKSLSDIQDSADAALKGLKSGDPFAARDYLESQMREMDARQGAAVAAEKAKATDKAEALGGKGQTNEYGEAIRNQLIEGRKAAKEIENRAWDAIDPEHKSLIDASPISTGADQITSEMPRLAKKMTGDEKSIFEDAASLTGPEKFREVTALRSRITDALQEELRSNGRSETYRRLSMLLGKVDDTILGAVERQATAEAATPAAVDTVAERVLSSWRSDFYSRKRAEGEAGRYSIAADGGNVANGSRGVSSGGSGKGAQTRQSGSSPGSDGSLQGNVDEGLAERYGAAKAATRTRASTFDEGPVGQATAAGKNYGGYSKADSQVAQTFFRPGAKSFDDAQAYMKAVGGRPEAVALGRDYLASDFRKAAIGDEGIIDPAKASKWIDTHQDVLRHFPELAEQFSDAATASETMGNVAAEHAEQIKAFGDSAARHFIGADPDKAIARVMSSADPAGALNELMRLARTSPEAQESIRTNLVQHLTRDGGEGLSKTLGDPKAMRAVNAALTPDQVGVLRGVAKAFDDAKVMTADHEQAVKTFQSGPAKHFQDVDPAASVARVMASKDPGQAFSDLMTLTKDSPVAQEAIRAAALDWVKGKAGLTAEVGSAGVQEMSNRALQSIVTDSKIMRGLQKVLSPDQVKTIQDVAKDTLRANRSTTAVKLPGGSNTTQDIHAVSKGAHSASPLSQVIAAEIGGEVLKHLGGMKLKVAGLVGGAVAGAARQAGLQKVDDLVTYAVLHPDIGRALLAKMPPNAKTPILRKLLAQIGNVGLGSPFAGARTNQR